VLSLSVWATSSPTQAPRLKPEAVISRRPRAKLPSSISVSKYFALIWVKKRLSGSCQSGAKTISSPKLDSSVP
jgi:hypothetical protein